MTFKPMLAGKADLATLRYPVMGSVKLDGIRCLAMGGRAMSRSMKPLPNRFIQAWFAENAERLEGMDGELIVGRPNAPDAYNRTVSAVMREDGEPNFEFSVFDLWNQSGITYMTRLFILLDTAGPRIGHVSQHSFHSLDEVENFERVCLEAGYEGVMLRDPNGPYKQGRSSTREGILLKLKRHLDAEARIVGFEEEMHNGNEAQTNELGRTKRSSHQENKTGKGTLGALIVEGVTAFPGVRFNVGTGFDALERAVYWDRRSDLMGKIVTFKYFPIGVKDAPRHPVFKGFRDAIDMDAAA
jgi:DNA ligase-1